jgi:DNA-binding NarL/FixJ family response regulator
MIIFDNKAAVLPLNISHAMEGILVVKDHSTIQALSELFELIWMHATPFGTSKSLAPDGLSEDERTVLRLLNQGLNDPQVARKMGRTDPQVRYIIKSLKTKTNARSKFELGALAAKAGWLATL